MLLPLFCPPYFNTTLVKVHPELSMPFSWDALNFNTTLVKVHLKGCKAYRAHLVDFNTTLVKVHRCMG